MRATKVVRKRNEGLHLLLLAKLKSGAAGKHTDHKTRPRKKKVVNKELNDVLL
jgi:hypothetical protein